MTITNDWHNADHALAEREAAAKRYCDVLMNAICDKVHEVLQGATVEHLTWNKNSKERLAQIKCADGVVLWVDVSSPSGAVAAR
jgi:hypothetical protein